MRKLRGFIPTTVLMLALAISAFANDGIIIHDRTGNSTTTTAKTTQTTTTVDVSTTTSGLLDTIVSLIGIIIHD